MIWLSLEEVEACFPYSFYGWKTSTSFSFRQVFQKYRTHNFLCNLYSALVWLSDMRCDHSVSWEVYCFPKREGGMGFVILVFKNIVMVGKWILCFPLEHHFPWHRVIWSMYGLDLIGWDVFTSICGSHFSSMKFV